MPMSEHMLLEINLCCFVVSSHSQDVTWILFISNSGLPDVYLSVLMFLFDKALPSPVA